MQRHTKIVATPGPSSSDKHTLARMIAAGMDVVRMNFSHGTAKEHIEHVELVRELARKAGRSVGMLVAVCRKWTCPVSARRVKQEHD